MDLTRLHFDVATAATSAASAGGAFVTAALPSFGLPVPELLSAFAGAALILSFLPPRPEDKNGRLRMLGTVLFCTFGAVWFGPLAAAKLGVEGKYQLGVTFALAAIAQVVIPMALERKEKILEWAKRLIPWWKA